MTANTNVEQRKTHIFSLTNLDFKQEMHFQDFDWESPTFDQKTSLQDMDGEPLQSEQELYSVSCHTINQPLSFKQSQSINGDATSLCYTCF